MSLSKATISAKRKGWPDEDKSFVWEAEAEIDWESQAGELIQGRFLDLTTNQLAALPGMKDVGLHIDGRLYRLLSLEPDGKFAAVKDEGQ